MVIEARPVFADILRKLSRAGSDMVYLVYQLYCVLHRPGTGKWSEIFILILFHHTREQNSGIFLRHGYFDIRICLIILQHCIVTRPVFFNQITLQDKGLQLRIRHDIFESGNP